MVAVANKPKPREFCPSCYEKGIETDLVYRPGSQFTHFCNNGHRWDDSAELSTVMMRMGVLMRERKAQMAPTMPEPEPDPVVELIPRDDRIKIDKIDQQRLEGVLGGSFGDSATLFGLIFAQNEQMKDLREKLERAEARIQIGQVRKLGGDFPMEIHIPERHVQPFTDLAEAGGMSLERWMNAQIESACDNGWFG